MAAPKLTPENFQVDRNDFGKADSLCFNVMTLVADEKYDRAVKQLEEFNEKDSGYPTLRTRTERQISHAIDIVNAIRTKRNFPGFKSLTASKQNELLEKTLFHFEELKYILKKIERIHVDVKLEDIRSTVIVLRAIVLSVVAILVVAFIKEVSGGLIYSTLSVLEEIFGTAADWFLNLVGW